MKTTNQKWVIDTQMTKRKESNWITKESQKTIKRTQQEKKGSEKNYKKNNKISNKMTINTYLSVMTQNVSGLNAPNKRQSGMQWIKKQDSSICCPQETHFRPKDTCILKVRGWRNIYDAHGCPKKAWAAILLWTKQNFKTKTMTKKQRRTPYNYKGDNPRRYTNCKYICTQQESTQIY